MATGTPGPKAGLLQRVVDAVREADWQCVISQPNHPFGLQLFHPDKGRWLLRVYIWNCTPGGKHRPPDEWRIQFTGSTNPRPHPGEVTLLLGWHQATSVFVGWDIEHHSQQAGTSPSAQVKEGTLLGANAKNFSTQVKTNGQVVVAFKSQFLVEYALASGSIHHKGVTSSDLRLLDDLSSLDDSTIAAVPSKKRRVILTLLAKRYRASDFRKRVLGAYRHCCAFCGVQLDLLDAAHILPVAAPGSTDSTTNGIALCKLHHAAFDSNLVSFNDRYKVEVSRFQSAQLRSGGRAGGLRDFRERLLPMILLPVDRRNHPVPVEIVAARQVRGWRA